ncbi:MAG: recombination mediator RecR [Patescibacteria group bacterium]
MPQKLPESLQSALDHFKRLPGIGPKTALRFIFYLLKLPPGEIEKFSDSIRALLADVNFCAVCHGLSAALPCPICADPRRNRTQICVVAETQDIYAIEATREFAGRYHVLGGLLNPPDGIIPDKLKIKELLARLAKEPAGEIILAINPTIEGESTMLYLTNLLKSYSVKVTRLARGLPVGGDLEYADEITLRDALRGRREMM